jgi:hypothetical protein
LKGEEMMLRSIACGDGSLFAIYDVQHIGKTVVFIPSPSRGGLGWGWGLPLKNLIPPPL